VIEHHRSGALKEQAVVLETGIVDDVLHAVLALEQFDHGGPALAPSVG
jgi:hypothetical protein